MSKWGTSEERHALQFYLYRIGPWFANYGPHCSRELWETLFLRVASTLPATKHLLTAIALLETPTATSEPSVLNARSQGILRNYTIALQELMKPNAHVVDLALAPVLGWLLESLSLNEIRAAQHGTGAQKLFKARSAAKKQTSEAAFPLDGMLDAALYHSVRVRCMRAKVEPVSCEDNQMFRALVIRNAHRRAVTTRQAHEAFEEFFQAFDPDSMTAADQAAAAELISQWEVAIVQSRYHTSEPCVLFNAVHFMCNLAMLLLPKPVISDVAGPETVGIALDYICDQCEQFSSWSGLTSEEKDSLNAMISLMLGAISRFAPGQSHSARAKRLLRTCSL